MTKVIITYSDALNFYKEKTIEVETEYDVELEPIIAYGCTTEEGAIKRARFIAYVEKFLYSA